MAEYSVAEHSVVEYSVAEYSVAEYSVAEYSSPTHHGPRPLLAVTRDVKGDGSCLPGVDSAPRKATLIRQGTSA